MLTAIFLCSVILAADPAEGKAETAAPSKPQFQAKARKDDTHLRFNTDGTTSIWDITCKSGIDETTITRLGDKWSEKIVVRLHLTGMESFNAANGDTTVHWSVTRSDRTIQSLWKGKKETSIASDSPYFTEVKEVADGKEKYFEVPLPANLFEGNPKEVRLWWIDFYRR